MKLALAAALLVASTALAAAHPCDQDAIDHAKPLLDLHTDGSGDENSIGDEVKVLPPVKALKGKGRFDVLEIWGYVYKAEYRMRFLYAQIAGSCVLMGQEILEASDPY
ncbi:MAG: hypothetical protein J0H63_05685 [Rhizobiales bacterium]|nr:hypothetical protein [Hyphomicrobiales bacterium]MBN9009637.1 hypothetical protein [Hyphomicrobiales bacterium]